MFGPLVAESLTLRAEKVGAKLEAMKVGDLALDTLRAKKVRA